MFFLAIGSKLSTSLNKYQMKYFIISCLMLLGLQALAQKPSKEQMEADKKKFAEVQKKLEEQKKGYESGSEKGL
jgi:hypothetical protein